MENLTPAARLLWASAWMVGTLTSFMAMAVAVRELSDTLQSFEILFFRSLIGLLLLLPLLPKYGATAWKTRRLKLHMVRNIFHFGGQFGWVYGIALLPLAEVFAIEFTIPIWAAILAVIFLGERMNAGRIIAIVLGFAGILVILRPGAEIINPAAFVVLGCAVCFASAHAGTKSLSATDSPLAILFLMSVIQLPMSVIPAYLQWVTPGWNDAGWLLILGGSGLTAHYCFTRAFQLADATIVIPMDFLRLPLIAVVGFLFYNEAIEAATLTGAAMIFVGNYYSIFREHRTQMRQEQ